MSSVLTSDVAQTIRPTRRRLALPRRDSLLPYVLILPAALLVLAVTGYGIYYAFEYSFYHATLAAKGNFVGFANYRAIFIDPTSRAAMLTTLYHLTTGSYRQTPGRGQAEAVHPTVPGYYLMETLGSRILV